MVVAVTVDIPGGTEEHYEQMMDRAFPGGTHPEGWLVHISGPTENGWRVLNVAASQEQFEVFVRELLLPAAGLEWDAGPPRLTRFPVHRLIWNRTSYTGPRRRGADEDTQVGHSDRNARSALENMPLPVSSSSTSASARTNRSSR
jgi:hypothetical protein